MNLSKLFSWAILAGSAALFVVVLWTRVVSPPKGAWRADARGWEVGEVPLIGADGRRLAVTHPAALYFFADRCRFCPPASEAVSAYVARSGTGGLPVFAITNDSAFAPASARFAPPIRAARLAGGAAGLSFVTEIPMLVVTDERGRIREAYTGVASEQVLRTLFLRREAGPVSQR